MARLKMPAFPGQAVARPRLGRNIPMPFTLAPTDLSFEERAEFSFDNKTIIEASPEDVLEVLESVENGRKWLPFFVRAEWKSGGDRGPDAILEETFRFMKLRLRVVAREPGRRWVASVEACSLPIGAEMLEDVELTPTPTGRTAFRWRIFYNPIPATRPFHPMVRPFFERFFRDATKGLAAYMKIRAPRYVQVAAR